MASATSASASPHVLPTSSTSHATASNRRFRKIPPARKNNAALSCGGTMRHEENARIAATTACSTSSAPPTWHTPTTCSRLDGLTEVNVLPVRTRSPSMMSGYSLPNRASTVAMADCMARLFSSDEKSRNDSLLYGGSDIELTPFTCKWTRQANCPTPLGFGRGNFVSPFVSTLPFITTAVNRGHILGIGGTF